MQFLTVGDGRLGTFFTKPLSLYRCLIRQHRTPNRKGLRWSPLFTNFILSNTSAFFTVHPRLNCTVQTRTSLLSPHAFPVLILRSLTSVAGHMEHHSDSAHHPSSTAFLTASGPHSGRMHGERQRPLSLILSFPAYRTLMLSSVGTVFLSVKLWR